MAALIKARKLAAIARAGADIVVSANPGCSMHLAASGVNVVHPMTLLAQALAAEDNHS
jgi:Fe-S oxidoreductase